MRIRLKSQTLRRKLLIPLAAFFCCAAILTAVCAVCKIAPFGDRTLLTSDMYGQYSSFIANLRSGDIFYNFSKSLGGDYYGLFAYYLASPLNLLTLLFPLSELPAAVTLLIAVKLSLTAFTGAVYFTNSRLAGDPDWNKLSAARIVSFSTAFALCGYAALNCFNVMWLDALILLPLIALGLERLVSESAPGLYILSLGAAILCNYYIGYMLCIYCCLYFAYLLFARAMETGARIGAFLRFAVSSLISGGIGGVILIPAILLMRTGKAKPPELLSDEYINLYLLLGCALASVILWGLAAREYRRDGSGKPIRLAALAISASLATALHLYFYTIAAKCFEPLGLTEKLFAATASHLDLIDGLPNIYAGIPAAILLLMFYTDKRLPARERTAHGLLLAALVTSCTVKQLDTVFHIFNSPTWFPCRYSFLISFTILTAAYREFCICGNDDRRRAAISGAALLLTAALVMDPGGRYTGAAVLLNLLLILVYTFLLLAPGKRGKTLLCAVCCFELLCNTASAFGRLSQWYGESGGAAAYREYVEKNSELLDRIAELDAGFYRVEETSLRTYNDSLLLGFRGVSHYSSTLNVNYATMMRQLGVPAELTWLNYSVGGTAASDSLFGIKYLIGPDAEARLTSKPYIEVDGSPEIRKNPFALGLAVRADEAILDLELGMDPLLNLEAVWSALCGEEISLYRPVEAEPEFNDFGFTLEFDMERDAPIVLYLESPCFGGARLTVNDRELTNVLAYETRGPVTLGTFAKGEHLSIRLETDAESSFGCVRVCYEDPNELSRASELLSGVGANESGGRVTVDTGGRGGVIFLTMPYENGLRAEADGEPVELSRVLNGFTAVVVPEGTDELIVTYIPPGFEPGLAVTAASLLAGAIYTALCASAVKRRQNG